MLKVIGYGHIVPQGMSLTQVPAQRSPEPDLGPCLRDRKAAKFMSKQDKLALVAATRAARMAGLSEEELRDRTGIYLAVGVLPFEEPHLESLYENSRKEGRFDLHRFSTDAFNAMNPLLTFKCLPNMPVFHISYNLGVHGRYYVTYPGTGQWFDCVRQAGEDLAAGRVEYALVGAVADQNNILVEHHLKRTRPEVFGRHVDAASAMVLTLREGSRKVHAELGGLELTYSPRDPFAAEDGSSARTRLATRLAAEAGAAGPSLEITLALDAGESGELRQEWRDGAGIEGRGRVTLRGGAA